MVALAALAVTTTFAAAPSKAPALLTSYKCYLCHADSEPKAGPAYVDVATRYRGDPHAIDTIATKIRDGVRGGGPWHMPPHPEVSKADARTMAAYIMALPP